MMAPLGAATRSSPLRQLGAALAPALSVALLTLGCRGGAEVEPEVVVAAPDGGPAPAPAEAVERDVEKSMSKPARGSGDPRHPAVDPATRRGVVAHVVLGSLARTVERARQQLVPGSMSWAVSDELLRTLIRAQFSKARARGGLTPSDIMVERLDLIAPIGCGLLDPAELPAAGACVFGYEGGASQLIRDIAALGSRVTVVEGAAADGHFASFTIDGEHTFFLDAPAPERGSTAPRGELRARVVASTHSAAYRRLTPFLRALTRDPPGLRDFEYGLYPGAYTERALSFLDARLGELAAGSRDAPAVAAALVDAARSDFGSLHWLGEQLDPGAMETTLAAVRGLSRDQAEQLARLTRELRALLSGRERVVFGVNLEGAGLVFASAHERRASAAPEPASPRAVDKAQLEAAPAASFWAGARAGPVEPARARVLVTLLALAYQSRTGQPRANLAPALEWLGAHLEQPTTWSLVHPESGPGALILRRAGAPASREEWRRWSEGFTAERVLGAEGAQHLRWRFIRGVDGGSLDRWVLRLEPAADELPGGPLPDGLRAWWIAQLGRELYIDRLARADETLWVIGPRPSPSALAAATDADADARLIDPGVPVMLARHRSTTRAFGFNIAATISWLDELSPARGWGALGGKLGGELSDVYRVDAWTARGGVSELVLSQRLLDQARASYGALAQLGGG